MLRRIGAVVAGVLVGVIIVTVNELICAKIYPLPPGTDLHDPKALAAAIKTLPIGALVLVLVGWFIAMLAASWIAAAIAHNRVAGAVAGVMLFVAAVLNMAMFPHPSWFKGTAFAIFLVAVTLGPRLGAPRRTVAAG
jgi:hypothetical protein